jgi:hypothetical protein
MADKTPCNNPDIPGKKQRQFALLARIVRHIVEKYGGSVKLDPASDTMLLNMPQDKTTACVQELQKALSPTKR